jgi:N12 class adenine-specific DNA methylase/predicted RNA methylase
MGFDFTFGEIIDTIERIKLDAASVTANEPEGLQYVDKPNRPARPRQAGLDFDDLGRGPGVPGNPSPGVENPGQMGVQFTSEIEGSRVLGGGGVVGETVGPTELGAQGVAGVGDVDGGAVGTRNPDDERNNDRAVTTGIGLPVPDYRITQSDLIGVGGAKAKYRENVAALRLLKDLEAQDRSATHDEQAILVKYVGWGGIPQAFDHRNAEWQSEFVELSVLLQKDEYEAARRSTQDSHYTPVAVINAVYTGLSGMGFGGGRLLDPALGTGHFIGMMPEGMRSQSKVTGIELDITTARIAKHLYPSATVINKGFQEVTVPSGYFDVAIGNPPFGNQTVFDANHRDISQLSIHNYFVAKSLDKIREGGLTAMVVSSYFMDAADETARAHIADRAHLLGAIRLPNTAFKQNALAEVTTDIIFLQRANPGEPTDRSWVSVGQVPDPARGEPLPLNSYFVSNPEMLLGTMRRINLSYRGGTVALTASPEQDLDSDLAQAIGKLPKGIYQERTHLRGEDAALGSSAQTMRVPESTKIGAYFIAEDGTVAQRLDDLLSEPQARKVEGKSERALERIKGMVSIRTSLRELMQFERTTVAQPGDVNDLHLQGLRNRLSVAYDTFVKREGYLSSRVNKQAMGEDPDYPLLQSLEHDYDKGISKEAAKKHGVTARPASAKKAAIFSRRVMAPRQEITHVDSAKDALVVSMNEVGRVDIDLIVRISGKDEASIVRDLQGIIFKNPQSQQWETAERYLSGNVKQKLAIAQEASKQDTQYAGNVEALNIVIPQDIEAVDIAVQLGSTWVPAETVSEFVAKLFGDVRRTISYQPSLGKWIASIQDGDQTTMHSTWGTPRISASTLMEAILTNRAIEIKDEVGRTEHGTPSYRTNEADTAAATQKADEMRQAFIDWIWEDAPRRDKLVRLYNDRFNTNVVPTYNGSHLTLPGSSEDVTLRISQKNAIWRGIQEGTALFDHVVGAGKTYACIGTAMESKRMNLIKKAMFAVPNHLLLQWKDDFYKLYPDAKVLVAEKSDFAKENRERLFARIATNDWDAVVVGHSSFKKIGMPQETLDEILNEQIEDLADAINAIKAEKGERLTIKEMEKSRDRMKAKLERSADTGTKDKVVTFDELGIDALFVDEADEFKNLFINTSLTRIAGLGNLQGSDKAFDLFVKARYLQKQNDGRGLYFATGTPVANTIAEIFTMQRYMQYNELKSRSIHHFDAWASTFGQVVTGWELDATGVNYKLNSRFSKFQNVPELTVMYRSFADVITRVDLERQAQELGKRFPVPKVAGGRPQNVVVERSPLQAKYMGEQEQILDADGKVQRRADGVAITRWTDGSIIHRMENLPKDLSIDNPLRITNDARKAGLDFRLIDPDAPDFEGSKTNAAIDNMLRLYEKWSDEKGVQLVFCDLSTPKAAKGAKHNKDMEGQDVAANDVDAEEDAEPSEVSMDELLAGGASQKFSVYDDVREKLIARGVPAEEIRFIHEAKTDLQRSKLFAQVRRGEVRFLLGSTAKMGAGTNVQRLLVGLHHLDAPWRPRDMEQREGRILRQGNVLYEKDPDNFEVEIFRYATKQTYDSRMWQTIEYKAAAIEQFRRGDGISRVIEDVAGEAANAAEMKAAASGNPLIFMQVQFAAEVKKLEAFHNNYKRTHHALERRMLALADATPYYERKVAMFESEIRRRDTNTGKDWVFTIGNRSYTNKSKDELQVAVLDSMQYALKTNANRKKHEEIIRVEVGQYRGFTVEAIAYPKKICFEIKGDSIHDPSNLRYDAEDNFSVSGFLQRIDNTLGDFDGHIDWLRRRHAAELDELEKAKVDLAKPFGKLKELELARKNFADVMTELRKMQDNPSYVSNWQPATLSKSPANDDLFAAVEETHQKEKREFSEGTETVDLTDAKKRAQVAHEYIDAYERTASRETKLRIG